jgi:hypothetical protein
MVDPRRKRLIFLLLGNMASGVVALVVIFFGIVSTGESGPIGPLFGILAVPAVGTQGWRIGLERWERDQAKVKQAAWQACWVLIAWEVAALVATGIFIYVALSAMAPVPHFDHWKSVLDLILISAAVALALWFTWVRSRRMLDLLSPLPGMPEPGSESPYVKLNL